MLHQVVILEKNNNVHISWFILTVLRCNALSHPNNGFVICKNGIAVGSVCSYSCIDGYALSKEVLRECKSDEQWSGEEASCRGMSYSQACHIHRHN